MTVLVSEEINVSIFFRNKKRQHLIDMENIKVQLDNEEEIQKIKDVTAQRARIYTESLRTLNDLVEKHGASGILFAAMGGDIKK